MTLHDVIALRDFGARVRDEAKPLRALTTASGDEANHLLWLIAKAADDLVLFCEPYPSSEGGSP